MKKVEKEKPLFALGIDKIKQTRTQLQSVFHKAITEHKELLNRNLEIFKRYEKGIKLNEIIAAKKLELEGYETQNKERLREQVKVTMQC